MSMTGPDLFDEDQADLEHIRVRNSDEPDELVIIPVDATEDELETDWITATGAESFVSLDDAR